MSPSPAGWHETDADGAVEQLYAAHWRPLVRLSVLLVRDQGMAEEVVQDAFVAVHGKWGSLRDPDRALAYLRRAVVNGSRSRLRHLKVVRAHAERQPPPGAVRGADEAALETERRAAVLDALEALPRRQREVIALRYYVDLSEAEIADALGISRGRGQEPRVARRRHLARPARRSLPATWRHPMTDPRLDPHHDARLSELIQDAVAGVEPGEGLTAIRSRTRPDHDQETTMSSSRNWLYAVGGAVAGTAAVIVAIAVVSQLNDDGNGSTRSPARPAARRPSPPASPARPRAATDTPTTADPSGTPVEGAVPVYYAGDSGRGTVLFREFQPGIGGDPVAQAAYAAVAGPPLDPDYRTLWPAGTEATASYDGDVITVDLTGADLHDRPAGHVQDGTPGWRSSRSSTACRARPRNVRACSSCSTVSAPTRCSG